MSEPSALLKAMRHVAKTKQPVQAGAEPSELHAKCRQYMLDDFKGFMQKLADLEKAHEIRLAKERERKQDEPKSGEPALRYEIPEQVKRLLDEEWAKLAEFEAKKESP